MRAPSGTGRRAGILLCIVLAVTACSDPEPPGTLPDRTPSASSTSASPTPATPEEEVEAAVRAYYAELSRAAQTNDTSKLRTMTTTGCPCYRPVRVIDKNESKGRTTPDARIEIASLRIHDIEGRTALAEVKTNEGMFKVFDSSAEVIGRVPARQNHLDLSLVQTEAGRWIIGNQFNLMGDR